MPVPSPTIVALQQLPEEFSPARKPWILPPLPTNGIGELQGRLAGITTHLSLWPAAACLVRWLEGRRAELDLDRDGLQILELGSGTGWLGMTLVANLERPTVVLTEREEAISDLRALCKAGVARGAGALRVEVLDWRDFHPGALGSPTWLRDSGGFDIVLGTDLVWNGETCSSFPLVCRALLEDAATLGRKTTIFYGHWLRAARALQGFLDACEEAGLLVTEEALLPFCNEPEPAAPDGPSDKGAGRASVPLKNCERDGSGSEDESPYMSSIFDSDQAAIEIPIFSVFNISLKARES